jgi:aspartate carbamoyltransferase catalytic subunit
MSWERGASLTSIRQFDHDDVLRLFEVADAIRRDPARYAGAATPFVLATLFYEPSTRTRLSFESAMLRLSGKVISTENAAAMSSAVKGESLQDTIRIVAGYADVIALRHHHQGAAVEAAAVSPVPIINAGDGAGEHPTQALLDAYLIYRHRGHLDNLTVTFVGDLAYGRTVHSLALLLAHFPGIQLRLVSPAALELPGELASELADRGVQLDAYDSIHEASRDTDILYVTRVQTERIPPGVTLERTGYRVDADVLERLPEGAVIMHPLPRVDELPPQVDQDPRAAYFEQARGGLQIRMALLLRALSIL